MITTDLCSEPFVSWWVHQSGVLSGTKTDSSQQLKQMRIDFSPITINLEVTWLPLVERLARLSVVQAGTSDLLDLPLMVTRLLLQLQPEQGEGGSTPATCIFQFWIA